MASAIERFGKEWEKYMKDQKDETKVLSLTLANVLDEITKAGANLAEFKRILDIHGQHLADPKHYRDYKGIIEEDKIVLSRIERLKPFIMAAKKGEEQLAGELKKVQKHDKHMDKRISHTMASTFKDR
ncbi:hypothetical protein JXB02_05025 [Candidatus Woesearchaeota archaeon]|nr:hypothetical protein [Candidatus Woesearchaeota archaeon]